MKDAEYIKYLEIKSSNALAAKKEEARHWRKALYLACGNDKNLVKAYMKQAEKEWK